MPNQTHRAPPRYKIPGFFSILLESVAETLADGVVEEAELRTTIPKLEAVIQECASLKYLLEDLSKKRKKKTKNQR
jgi:hypothetical protein